MSRGLNKVMIIGHLGRDPEMRYTPSGRPVTSFSLATTRSWNSPDGERREETEWFNIVAWGNLAEICRQYLTKGQQVYIEGRLQTRRWEDQEGKKGGPGSGESNSGAVSRFGTVGRFGYGRVGAT